MEVLKLINEIEDIIEDGSTVPFSKKVMVERDEILEIIKEIRIMLPDEIKQASWIKEEKQRILVEAEKEAGELMERAQKRAEELIEDETITSQAKKRAEEIINKANYNSREIMEGAMEYADELLSETQEKLKKVIELLDENRNELQGLE